MAKLSLDDLTSLANQLSALAKLADNYASIEAAFENTLSRDGTGPNAMEADLDLNSNRLLNVADPVADTDGVNVRCVESLVNGFASQIATTIIQGTGRTDPFTATAAQTTFTLTDTPGSIHATYLTVNGLVKTPNIDYTLAGKVITWMGPALSAGDKVVVRYTQLAPADSLLRSDLEQSITGKGAALIGWKSLLAQAIARVVSDKLGDFEPSPEDFGAVGDGVADDTAALVKAMACGRIVNAWGRTYAVSGNLVPPSGFKGFRNITFKQLTPGGGTRRTLLITGRSDFVLDRVRVTRGGTGAEYTTLADMIDNAGIYISNCTDFVADYLEVSGGGVGTGIAVLSCQRFSMQRPYVHDMQYVLGSDPGDDRIQGIWLDNNAQFTIYSPTARTLGGNFGAGATTRWARGMILGGNAHFTIYAPDINGVDQGVDITGSVGNRFGRIIGGHVQNCYTWGYKAANSQRWISFIGCTAEDCGFAGFVASGPSTSGLPASHDVKFIDCVAHNTGSNGFWSASNVSGFLVQINGAVDPSYPRGVKFIHCRAVDDQTTKTMKYGFYNEASNTGFDDTNETIGCYSEGHTIAQAFGFHKPECRMLATSAQSIPNAAYTYIDFPSEDYDTSGMHSTSSNVERATIPVSGTYLLQANVQFDVNATGRRGARFSKNGAAIPYTTNLIAANSLGAVTVPIATTVALTAGDFIRVEGYQDSGGALNTTANASALSVTLLRKD